MRRAGTENLQRLVVWVPETLYDEIYSVTTNISSWLRGLAKAAIEKDHENDPDPRQLSLFD